MRTVTVKLYEFDELNEQAKQIAIEELKQASFDASSESDWNDANETIRRIKEMAGVDLDIQFSLQGPYVKWGYDKTHEYELTDQQQFENLRKSVKNGMTYTWADDMMIETFDEATFDRRRRYLDNVGDVLLAFCTKVYRETLAYLDEESVIEYIGMNEYEFTEDGRVCNASKLQAA